MPVGIMTSKAQKSDRAPPIGVSLPSFLHQSPRKCLCVCVCVGPRVESGWLQAASGAGRLCIWLQLKWTNSFAGLGT